MTLKSQFYGRRNPKWQKKKLARDASCTFLRIYRKVEINKTEDQSVTEEKFESDVDKENTPPDDSEPDIPETYVEPEINNADETEPESDPEGDSEPTDSGKEENPEPEEDDEEPEDIDSAESSESDTDEIEEYFTSLIQSMEKTA